MPHVEERVACMGTVVRFLDECLHGAMVGDRKLEELSL
jgi:L-proline amide hydrolase